MEGSKTIKIEKVGMLEEKEKVGLGKEKKLPKSILKKTSKKISNLYFDSVYSLAIKSGALGGKLLGAGGGGFFLFICNNSSSLEVLEKKGLRRVKFKFDFEGTKVLFGD